MSEQERGEVRECDCPSFVDRCAHLDNCVVALDDLTMNGLTKHYMVFVGHAGFRVEWLNYMDDYDAALTGFYEQEERLLRGGTHD